MQMTKFEQGLLAGQQGEALQRVFDQQVAVAKFFQAERFVPITNAHLMADWEVMGEAGYAYLEWLVSLNTRVVVPTHTDAQCVDFAHAVLLRQDSTLVDRQRLVRGLLRRLGIATVDTCINYQSVYQPHYREHVAWGDTGGVIYANSVLGARSNYESGPAALAAALTGRTPCYGFHLDEHRKGNVRCRVEAKLVDLADWGALGAIVGQRVLNYWSVPVFEGLSDQVTADALKHLGASLASYGSIAMFHIVGVTPEAPTADAAYGGRAVDDEIVVRDEDIEAAYAQFVPSCDVVDLVVFTAPQLSLAELAELSQLLEGKQVHPNTRLIITTNAMNRAAAAEVGYLDIIEKAGAIVLQGVCWYLMAPAAMREKFGWTNVVTNSAKLANIIRGHGYEPILRRTVECVHAAIIGRLA